MQAPHTDQNTCVACKAAAAFEWLRAENGTVVVQFVCTAISAAALELDLSEDCSALTLSSDLFDPVRVELPVQVQEEDIHCQYDRANGQLTVRLVPAAVDIARVDAEGQKTVPLPGATAEEGTTSVPDQQAVTRQNDPSPSPHVDSSGIITDYSMVLECATGSLALMVEAARLVIGMRDT